ncbi:MAG: DUF2220 family protein [Desulfovermiculus sp.]
MLKKCLAWSELLEQGQTSYSKILDPLIEAGLAVRQGRVVVLVDAASVQEIVNTQCPEVIQTRNEAQDLARRLGLEVNITSRPWEALQLLRDLEKNEQDPGTSSRMQGVSARVFGDSKHIQRIPVLSRIFAQWSRDRHLRGELRLKAFGPVFHRPNKLDLGLVTASLGQVCIPGPQAARVQDFDLGGIDFMLTSENLAPFQQILVPKGLVLFCPGYNTGLSALWLQSLHTDCQWIHFGDFDPDGLRIFEQLRMQSGREGRFVPDLEQLKEIQSRLPTWNGAREFDPRQYATARMQEMAVWGRDRQVYAEQEQVLHLLGWERFCSKHTGITF